MLDLYPLTRIGLTFHFLKSCINSNHFDPNWNLNYERLLHAKQYTRALHHTMKSMHRHEMQQIIIYLNKQFSRVLFPCENQGVTPSCIKMTFRSILVNPMAKDRSLAMARHRYRLR
jgi:hypothetical protein